MLIRKYLFIAHNYSELFKHTEDYDLWVTLIFHTKAANLDDVLIKYRMHTKNISVTSSFEQNSNANKIQIRMINKILCYRFSLRTNDSVGFYQNANKNNSREYIHLFAHLYDNFRYDSQISKIEFSSIKSDIINRVMYVIRKDIISHNFLLGLMIMIKVDVFYTIKLIARVTSMKLINSLKSSSRS